MYSARLSRLLSVVFAFQPLYSVICFLRPGNLLPASLNHCLTLAFLPAPLGLFARLDFWLWSSPASLFQKPPRNKSLNCISLSSLFTSGCPPLLPLNVTPCLIHDLWHFSGICLVAPALFFKKRSAVRLLHLLSVSKNIRCPFLSIDFNPNADLRQAWWVTLVWFTAELNLHLYIHCHLVLRKLTGFNLILYQQQYDRYCQCTTPISAVAALNVNSGFCRI